MVTFGFFDSVNGDRKYSADDISNFFETLIPDGVMAKPENTFQVCESSGMTIKVLAGWGFIGRKWIHNDYDLFLTLDQPDIVLNRADRIVLRLNRELRNMEIAVKRGTPGENPVKPDLQRDENVWEISLAYIMVWAGTTGITQNDIGDERNDTNFCGRIIGFDKLVELLNEINALKDCQYTCNGWSDNVSLPEFIASWSQSHPGKILKVVGNFGVNDDTTDIDGIAYSMAYENTSNSDVTLDFSECSLITPKPWSFGFFSGCHVQGLKIRYDNTVLGSENTGTVNVLEGRNVIFEDCHIYGSASGSETGFVSCYKLEDSFLIRCSTDFSSENSLWGITGAGDSVISECDIQVTGTADEAAYGITASDVHCSSSKFKAVGSSAYGGSTGGDFTECVFEGLGETNGYGFRISMSFHANNCTFRGYTKDAESGNGYGLYGETVSNILMQGIRCPKQIISGYSQTGSMVFTEGSGFYTGDFYMPPKLPASETIVTYTDFKPTREMTQAEYDALESYGDNTLYVLT